MMQSEHTNILDPVEIDISTDYDTWGCTNLVQSRFMLGNRVSEEPVPVFFLPEPRLVFFSFLLSFLSFHSF